MRQTFPASLDHLYSMLAFIRERSIATGFDPISIAHLELACEEALVNIISYAYPKQQGVIDIQCSVPDQPGIKIALRDQGVPYDPLSSKSHPKDPKKLGGYGISLIIKIMDRTHYQRDQKDNVLTLIKYLR